MGGVYAEFKSGIFMGCPWRKESARRWGAPQRWSLARMRSAGSRFRGSGGRMLRDGPPRMVARPIWSGRERSSHSRFPPVPRVGLVTFLLAPFVGRFFFLQSIFVSPVFAVSMAVRCSRGRASGRRSSRAFRPSRRMRRQAPSCTAIAAARGVSRVGARQRC